MFSQSLKYAVWFTGGTKSLRQPYLLKVKGNVGRERTNVTSDWQKLLYKASTMFHRLASMLSVRAVEPDTTPEEGTDPPEEPRPLYRKIPRDPAMLSQYPPTQIPWLSSPENMGLGPRGSMQTYLEQCQSCRWISGLSFIGAGVYVYMSARARIRYTRSTGPLFRIFFALCLGVAGVTIIVDPQKKIQDDWLRRYEERQRRLRMRREHYIANMEKEEETALTDGSVQK